jgi:hypothetical protein
MLRGGDRPCGWEALLGMHSGSLLEKLGMSRSGWFHLKPVSLEGNGKTRPPLELAHSCPWTPASFAFRPYPRNGESCNLISSRECHLPPPPAVPRFID